MVIYIGYVGVRPKCVSGVFKNEKMLYDQKDFMIQGDIRANGPLLTIK